MTKQLLQLSQNLTTKSGKPVTIGTGTGTKWQWLKKSRPEEIRTTIVPELVDQLLLALKNGYNHIDTAEVYTTHAEVSEAVKKSGIAREDVFITSKYNPGFTGHYARSKSPGLALDAILKDLDTDYLDLYLIHSPFFTDEFSHGHNIESAWQDLIDAKKAGKVREIGVSNFAVDHLKKTFKVAGSPEFYPKVNQIEFHPYLQNQTDDIVKFSQDNGILIEAFGPLTPLFRIKKDDVVVEDHPLTKVLPSLVEKYGKTDSQILLRYTLQKGILPITTSSKEERIKQALEITEFELSDEDVQAIDKAGEQFAFRGFFVEPFKTYKPVADN